VIYFQGLVGAAKECFRCGDHELAGGRGRKEAREEATTLNASMFILHSVG